MTTILDIKYDDIEVGQKITVQDRYDTHARTYYERIKNKMKIYECAECKKKVGHKYVQIQNRCDECNAEFVEKVAVKFE